jgi:isopentenyl-diphosphate delta-isomerase
VTGALSTRAPEGTAAPELVVLLNERGEAIGTAPKETVHGTRTPLHLAFSCYVFDRDRRLLVTRRSAAKPTFPGVWTNSFCGHPAPGEDLVGAVTRRARQELGIGLAGVRLVLPAFRYQARMPTGVLENEMCPVFCAVASGDPSPDPSEADAFEWVPWATFSSQVLGGERRVSSWCREQVAQLIERSDVDGGFVSGDWADLPAAAR